MDTSPTFATSSDHGGRAALLLNTKDTAGAANEVGECELVAMQVGRTSTEASPAAKNAPSVTHEEVSKRQLEETTTESSETSSKRPRAASKVRSALAASRTVATLSYAGQSAC